MQRQIRQAIVLQLRHWLRRPWLLAALAATVLLALLAWQAGRESSLQLLARSVAQASGGDIAIEGVHGTLYGPIHIDRLRYRSPERKVEATDIDLDWNALSLLRRTIAVRQVRAASLDIVTLAASSTPATMPTSLALPYGLRLALDAVRLERLTLSAGPVSATLDHLRFALHADSGQWRLQDAYADTPWGAASSQLTLASQPPFALAGRADLLQANGQLGIAASGNLGALHIAAQARGHGGNADAQLDLAPFDAGSMLRTVRLSGTGLDPAQWDKRWPQADLTLGASIAVAPGGGVDGKIALANRAPSGRLDQHLLPLRSVDATLAGTLEALRLDGVVLDLGAAGKLGGSGNLGGAMLGAGGKTGGAAAQAAFRLHTERLDLHAIDGTLRSTRIAGDITLGSDGATHLLAATLSQDDLRLKLRAALAGATLSVTQADLRSRASSITLDGSLELGGRRLFQARANARHFNPADFGAYPKADLNADVRLNGQADQAWRVAAAFTLQPSTLLQRSLSGHGELQADSSHIHTLDARLALGGNMLAVRGNFGAPGDQLRWTVDAGQLAVLHSGLSGSLTASGIASGSYAAPTTSITLDARGLRQNTSQNTSKQADNKADQRAGTRSNIGNSAGKRADSHLHASGMLALREGIAEFRLGGQARQFDPAALLELAGGSPAAPGGAQLRGPLGAQAGSQPSSQLSGDFTLSGRLGGNYQTALDLNLLPSTLFGAPLSGHARLRADKSHIQQADIDLQLAENRLRASGKFGASGDALAWQLEAPRLAVLGPGFGGALRANGTLKGSREAPAATLALDGRGLTLFGSQSIGALTARLQTSATSHGALEAHLTLQDYRAPEPLLQALSIDLSGSMASHIVRLTAKNARLDLTTELRGRLSNNDWRGVLQSLQNRGPASFALQAPAPLHVQLDGGQLGLAKLSQFGLDNAIFKLSHGQIELQKLEKNGVHWKTQGRAAGVPLAFAAQFSAPLQDMAGGDLTLGANWNFELGNALNGALRVFREKGDVAIGAETPLKLGLSVLEARLTAVNNALRAQGDLQGTRAGKLHVDLASQLTRQNGQWRVAGNSPLTLSGSADMPSIAWLAPLTGQVGLELGGHLTLAVTAGGSFDAPLLNGQLRGEQLTVNWADQGVKLHNGQLRAQLAGQEMVLQTLRFDGVQGSAHADGTLHFGAGEASMQLKLVADKLEALSRPDRILVVSGQGSATLAKRQLQLEGKFKADRAAIELAGSSGPTQSDDIVVVRGAKKPLAAAAPTVKVLIDVEADLGDQFRLKGKGIDAQLGGTVRVRLQERAMARATGAIHVIEGTYLAYGQKLQIERGVLTFNGPLDNPGINILAVRKNDDSINTATSETNVQAGVEVRGTALAPTAKLVSTPTVADSEKLSWLVLGHGTDSVGSGELDLLSTAAGALLGGSSAGSMQNKLAGTFGVDSIAMGRAKGLETTVLTVSKRISQRAYVTIERGASSATSLVKLHYALNRRLSLQAQTGATTAFDILYNWAFD